jgi:hypothetical protein
VVEARENGLVLVSPLDPTAGVAWDTEEYKL